MLGESGGYGSDMAHLELSVPPIPSSVPASRRKLRAWLDSLPCNEETREDVLVVLSELVTNGVIHDGGAAIAVMATSDASGIVLEVDTADGMSPTSAYHRRIADTSEAGRGLAIVSALADSVTMVAARGRRHVRCHLSPRP